MINGFNNAIALEAYIKNGGVISSPSNVTTRYRADILQLMAAFVDSEFAASAGLATILNQAPGLTQRADAARIMLEKAESGALVLNLMSDFGVDISQYGDCQQDKSRWHWSDRLERDGDLDALETDVRDMRAPVFYYPFKNWCDAMMMNVLMGKARQLPLQELSQISYAPLAEAFATISQSNQRHANFCCDELLRLTKGALKTGAGEKIEASFWYWLPKVRAIFGAINSSRFERHKGFGLRHSSNKEMLAAFNVRAEELRKSLQLVADL